MRRKATPPGPFVRTITHGHTLALTELTADRIYTSAYWRTLQTVHFLPCATDRLYVEPGLGERVLDDGLHPPIPLSSLQTAHFPAIDPAYAPFHLPEPAQESRADLMRRMATVAEELVRRCDADEGVETVLWGTHASPALCLARALLGDDEAEVHTYVRGLAQLFLLLRYVFPHRRRPCRNTSARTVRVGSGRGSSTGTQGAPPSSRLP